MLHYYFFNLREAFLTQAEAFIVRITSRDGRASALWVMPPVGVLTGQLASSEYSKTLAGKPVAYKLVGTPNPLVFAHPQSMIGQRAQFAFKNLWVTPHSDQERYPAGDYTIGSHGGAGLSEWTKQVSNSLARSLFT